MVRLLSLLAILLVLFVTILNVEALKISDVSVLIPWESDGFTIFVNSTASSCVEWATDSPHLVKLQYDMCSTTVKVIPLKNAVEDFGEKKVSSIITVTDGVDRATCEVYLGHLHRIEMLTSARKLYLGEVDTLDIIGFDEEGNTFETLSGLQFDWKTEKITNKQKDGAIRLLPLNDVNVRLFIDPSKHSNTDFISSQTIICEGLEIGQARVVVSLRSDSSIYDAVDFSVYDKFLLKPSPYMRVIPTSVFTYQLFRRNLKKEMSQVVMPNPNFEWFSTLEKIGTVDSKNGIVTAKEVGITSIIAKDLSFELNRAKGTVQVVTPVRIAFKFTPVSASLYDGYEEVRKLFSDSSENGSNLIVDVDYNVQIELFDDKNQKVHITDNIQFEVSIQNDGDIERSQIVNVTSNMHTFGLKALAIGESNLKARLIGSAGDLFPIFNTQTMHIYPRVNIAHPERFINLPATSTIRQKYKLNAHGGSNRHNWLILTSDIAAIDAHGVISAKHHGSVRVFVFDVNNVFNGDIRWVRVSQPHALHWLPGKRETEVGTHLCLQINMFDVHGNAFAAFDSFKIVTKIGDYNIYSEGKGGCGPEPNTFDVQANKVGYTTLQARLVGFELREEVPIVAFDPLSLKTPKNDVDPIVIALGSTQPLYLSGGPVEWGHYQIYRSSKVSVKIIDNEQHKLIPVVRDERRKNQPSFLVTCRHFGERLVEFEVTNDIHVKDAERTVVKLSRTIICAHPERAVLVPHNPIGGEDRYESKELTPIDENASILAYHVAINSSVILKIDLYDGNGNKFSSFNSLTKTYILSNTDLASFPDSISTYDGKRYLHIGSKEGLLLAHSTILNYENQVMKEARVIIQPPKISLTSPEIQLRTNVPISLSPKKLLLFNHPSISGEFVVSGGSDEYLIRTIPSQVITHEVSGKSIIVSPKAEGETSLLVQDARFEAHPSAKAVISVADVAFVEIEGPHYIELGEKISLTIKVFDKLKREFEISQLIAMQPKLISHSPSTSASSIVDISQQRFHLYTIQGKQLGTVDVIASVVNSDSKVIRSQPFQIHVYPPIRVEPPTLVLIPGAKYQVKLLGGPSFDKSSYSYTENEVVFSGVDKALVRRNQKEGKGVDVITIDKRGVVTAITYGKAIVLLKRNVGGQQFASKEVEIYVVRLQTLNFPLTLNMYDDSLLSVPFRSTSIEGYAVDALSVQSQFFTLSYMIEDSDVVKILPPSRQGHTLHLEALKPGHAKLRVFAKFTHPHLDSYNLEQDIIVYVVEKLRLTDGCTSKIIVSPSTHYKVNTNSGSNRFYVHTVNEEQNQVKISEAGGLLSSGPSGESTILHVRDVLTGQSIVTKVEVHDPSYLDVEGRSNIIFLPLGSSRTLKYFGLNKFAEKMASVDGVEIAFRSNMYEYLDISLDPISQTIQLRALTIGNTTIQLYSPSIEHTFDFKVVVMSTIRPSNPVLIVGDNLQFQIAAADSDKQGFWSSSDSSILQIDPVKGVGIAKSPGTAVVQFTSNYVSTSSQVYVKRISSAQLATSRRYILVSRREKSNEVFKIPIALFDQDGEYISLDWSESPRTLVRKLSIECQPTNSLVRVVRSEIVKDRVVCIVQQNIGASLSGDARVEFVRFILNISDGLTTYTVQSDPFNVNLTDSTHPKIDQSQYMIGERMSTQLSPPINIANVRSLAYQIGFIVGTLLIAVLIYKCLTVVGPQLVLATAGRKRTLPPPDLKFDRHDSYFDSNGIKLRN